MASDYQKTTIMAHPPSYNSIMGTDDMESITKDLASTSINADTIKFEDCNISFAIDQSGSTSGGVLDHEKSAIRTLSSQLSTNARSWSKVLPWSSTAANPIRVPDLNCIESYGGTTPNSLLANPLTQQALSASDMWFLLTDGFISSNSIRRFALSIAQNGLHGTACVIIIFARARDKPADCNISVGVSVFAAVPDCLFLFFDTSSSQMYMLQCSGRFTQILEERNEDQPILEPGTEWSDLPRVTFTDLACVSVRVPKRLSRDELILPDGLLINLNDMWQGGLNDSSTVDRIFKNDDNLKSIMLTAQTRGEVTQFQNWLKPFLDDKPSPPADHSELERETTMIVRQVIEEIQSGASGERLNELQSTLRTSYDRDASYSNRSSRYDRSKSSQAAFVRSSQGGLSRGSVLSSIVPESHSIHQGLKTPGFQKSRHPQDMFLGDCTLCGGQNTNLVLLLRACPAGSDTDGCPLPNGAVQLTCPLAIGNFPETDIISQSICCDNCSYYMAQGGWCPNGEELKCVLPLVTYTTNREAYKLQLRTALENRFHEDDLIQLLLAISVNAYQRLPARDVYNAARSALKWLCKDLLLHYTYPGDMFFQSDNVTHSARFNQPLGRTIVSGFQNIYRPRYVRGNRFAATEPEGIFNYPLSGFVVMVLALQYAEIPVILPFGMQNIVWQRFLFLLVKNYRAREDSADDKAGTQPLQTIQQKLKEDCGSSGSDSSSSTANTPILTPRSSTNDTLASSPMSSTKSIIDVLVEQKLLATDELKELRSLGQLFDSIENETSPAIFTFVQALVKVQPKDQTPWQIFDILRRDRSLSKVFEEPLSVSANFDEVPAMVARATSPENAQGCSIQ